MRSALNLIIVFAAAIALLVPVAIGGRPSAFPDTAFYYSQGEFLASRMGLADAQRTAEGAIDPTSLAYDRRQAGPTALDTVLAARPAAYGLLLYGASRVGGLWLLAFLQAAAAASLLLITMKTVLGRAPASAYGGLIAGLAATSSLPFLAGFSMPDLFAGLSVLAASLLLVYPDRLSRAQGLASAGLIAFGCASHPIHWALVAVLIALSFLPKLPGGAPGGGHRLVIGAVLAGVMLAALASAAVTAPSHKQGSPPFLTARILADGPGRLYLRKACSAGAPHALCAFRHQPLDQAEDVLWSTDPARGVFSRSPVATRLALQREQPGFVVATILAHPLMEAGALSANAARQLIAFSVTDELRNASDFFRQPFLARTRLPGLIPNMAPCRLPLRACANRLPYDGLKIVQQSTVLLSLGLMAGLVSRPGYRERLRAEPWGDAARLVRLAALGLVAILINAMLCGGLSGPFPRYGARLIWLIPALAILLLIEYRRPRPASPFPSL